VLQAPALSSARRLFRIGLISGRTRSSDVADLSNRRRYKIAPESGHADLVDQRAIRTQKMPSSLNPCNRRAAASNTAAASMHRGVANASGRLGYRARASYGHQLFGRNSSLESEIRAEGPMRIRAPRNRVRLARVRRRTKRLRRLGRAGSRQSVNRPASVRRSA